MASLHAVARGVCPYCRSEGMQSWEADVARPAVLWSMCRTCEQIAIWEQGVRTFPLSPGAALTGSLPQSAHAALLVAAYEGRDQALTRTSSAREALEVAAQHMDAALHFLALFTRYDVASGDSGPAASSVAH